MVKVWDINSQEYKDEIIRIENLANKPGDLYTWDDNINEWIFDIDNARLIQLQKIRDCREACWQKFDGLFLGYDRDDNYIMCADCEILRESIKDSPENSLTALNEATTLEEIESITFMGILTIPTGLQDIVNKYFN